MNKMSINYLKNSTFHSLKVIVDALIDVRNESSKHDFLKSVKINTLPCFLTQIFQSVSGHSSEQSIDHYRSQPTVSQLKGVSDTISGWFESHQAQRTHSTVTKAPFIQNSNWMASRLTTTASFLSVFFQFLQLSRQRPLLQAFQLTGNL